MGLPAFLGTGFSSKTFFGGTEKKTENKLELCGYVDQNFKISYSYFKPISVKEGFQTLKVQTLQVKSPKKIAPR